MENIQSFTELKHYRFNMDHIHTINCCICSTPQSRVSLFSCMLHICSHCFDRLATQALEESYLNNDGVLSPLTCPICRACIEQHATNSMGRVSLVTIYMLILSKFLERTWATGGKADRTNNQDERMSLMGRLLTTWETLKFQIDWSLREWRIHHIWGTHYSQVPKLRFDPITERCMYALLYSKHYLISHDNIIGVGYVVEV